MGKYERNRSQNHFLAKFWQAISGADASDPLAMNIFISFFTVLFLGVVIFFLNRLSPELTKEEMYRLVIDTYVPSIFTLCVSLIIQTFVEAVHQGSTRFMLNLISMGCAFFYLLCYVVLPKTPSVCSLWFELIASVALLFMSLAALNQILKSEKRDFYQIAAHERRR